MVVVRRPWKTPNLHQRVEDLGQVFELLGGPSYSDQRTASLPCGSWDAPGSVPRPRVKGVARPSTSRAEQGHYYQIFDGEVKRYLSDAAYDRARVGLHPGEIEGAPEVLGLPKAWRPGRAARTSQPPAMDRLTLFRPGRCARARSYTCGRVPRRPDRPNHGRDRPHLTHRLFSRVRKKRMSAAFFGKSRFTSHRPLNCFTGSSSSPGHARPWARRAV